MLDSAKCNRSVSELLLYYGALGSEKCPISNINGNEVSRSSAPVKLANGFYDCAFHSAVGLSLSGKWRRIVACDIGYLSSYSNTRRAVIVA